MPISPPSFRYPFANLAKLAPEAREAHLATFNALTDIYQALALQKQNSSTSTTTLNETVLGTSGNNSTTAGVSSFNGETGDVSYFPDLFFVNNQSGLTAYTTQTADAGAFVILNDASPIAVGLNYNVATNWSTWIANYGAGTATLTPVSVPSGATSTISYPGNLGASSMPLGSGVAALIFFDGVNFWAVPVPIGSTSGGVTQIIAGTNVNISPVGGTGNVTINATAGSISRIPHDVTGSRSFGSIFQNTTGQEMWVTGWGGTTGGATSELTALIDTVNPPLTALWGNEYTGSVSGGKAGFGFVVPNNYYYELVLTGTGAITSLGKWVEYF